MAKYCNIPQEPPWPMFDSQYVNLVEVSNTKYIMSVNPCNTCFIFSWGLKLKFLITVRRVIEISSCIE